MLAAFLTTAIQCGHLTLQEVAHRAEALVSIIEEAFDRAITEPKITDRGALMNTNSQPIAAYSAPITVLPSLDIAGLLRHGSSADEEKFPSKKPGASSDVMRKHMTKCFEEILGKENNAMYIGEDVQHGG